MISNDFHAVFDEITESNGPIPDQHHLHICTIWKTCFLLFTAHLCTSILHLAFFSRLYIGVTLRHYRQSPCEKHTNHTGRHCHAWKPWNSKIPPDLFSLQICEASQNTKVTHKTYKIIWIVSTWHGLKLWNLTWLYPSLCHTNLSMLMVLPISQTLWHGPILIILQNR